MSGDRVDRVCASGSGHHYVDRQNNKYENEDTCVMLCKMVSGALVKIRVDMLSDRPHAMMNYQLRVLMDVMNQPEPPENSTEYGSDLAVLTHKHGLT